LRITGFAAWLLFTGLAVAQAPRIGTIDFYGLRKVPEAKILQTLGVREGDFLPPSKGDAEEHLDDVPGIVESHLEAVCCDTGKMILYVGVEEKGSPHFDIREAPEGDVKLPEEITSSYRRFLESFESAVRSGRTGEDLTHGHSLSADPATRADQEMFPALAKDHLAELRDAIRNAADDDQRAVAAYIIGYAPNKKEVVGDLQYALKDADAGVRNNAVRGLMAMAVLARLDPAAQLKIEPTWFIEMLNSLSWSDRNRALQALQILTDKRDPATLEQLRDRALPALVEMARWKTLAHALPAFVLLGRIAEMPDAQVQTAWTKGDRESVILAATNKKKSR